VDRQLDAGDAVCALGGHKSVKPCAFSCRHDCTLVIAHDAAAIAEGTGYDDRNQWDGSRDPDGEPV
jgi:hypothetical protein